MGREGRGVGTRRSGLLNLPAKIDLQCSLSHLESHLFIKALQTLFCPSMAPKLGTAVEQSQEFHGRPDWGPLICGTCCHKMQRAGRDSFSRGA